MNVSGASTSHLGRSRKKAKGSRPNDLVELAVSTDPFRFNLYLSEPQLLNLSDTTVVKFRHKMHNTYIASTR